MNKLLSYLIQRKTDLSHRGAIFAAGGAFFAIMLVIFVSEHYITGVGLPIMVASMGATAVILFAAPHSPMAKPLSVAGGQLISACIGVFCYQTFPSLMWACAIAIFMVIAAMIYLRCLHPPGGATAMAAILGGPKLHALGYQFVLTPVGLNVMTIVLVAIVFHYFTGVFQTRLRPITATEGWWDLEPVDRGTHRVPFNQADLSHALKALDTFIDVTEEDLQHIYSLAMMHSHTRHLSDATCGDIMQRDPECVEFGTLLSDVWALLKQHDLRGVPVIDRGNHVIGIITVADFLKHAGAMPGNTAQERLQALITPVDDLYSEKPEVAGQIMITNVRTLADTATIAEVVALFRKHDIHHVPIVNERNKLLGMVSIAELKQSQEMQAE